MAGLFQKADKNQQRITSLIMERGMRKFRCDSLYINDTRSYTQIAPVPVWEVLVEATVSRHVSCALDCLTNVRHQASGWADMCVTRQSSKLHVRLPGLRLRNAVAVYGLDIRPQLQLRHWSRAMRLRAQAYCQCTSGTLRYYDIIVLTMIS